MPGDPGELVVTTLVWFLFFPREAAGALGTRHSPRPQGGRSYQNSGASRRGNVKLCPLAVIARSEATKQSILSLRDAMDCFAEPVIGRAFARPAGSQ
jgi:hypothetical protein